MITNQPDAPEGDLALSANILHERGLGSAALLQEFILYSFMHPAVGGQAHLLQFCF